MLVGEIERDGATTISTAFREAPANGAFMLVVVAIPPRFDV
jgi:hypothetical protein